MRTRLSDVCVAMEAELIDRPQQPSAPQSRRAGTSGPEREWRGGRSVVKVARVARGKRRASGRERAGGGTVAESGCCGSRSGGVPCSHGPGLSGFEFCRRSRPRSAIAQHSRHSTWAPVSRNFESVQVPSAPDSAFQPKGKWGNGGDGRWREQREASARRRRRDSEPTQTDARDQSADPSARCAPRRCAPPPQGPGL